MTRTADPYVALYGLATWLKVLLPGWWLFAVALVVASAVVLPQLSTDVGTATIDRVFFWFFTALCVFCIVVFAGSALGWTMAIAQRRLALGLGDDGITLGRVPFPPTRRVTVPWADLEAIILYERDLPYVGYQPFLALRLRDGADRPPGVPQPGSIRARLNRRPGEVSRPIKGWRLDRYRLVQVVRAYAPQVLLVGPDGSVKRARNARPQELIPKPGAHWHGW